MSCIIVIMINIIITKWIKHIIILDYFREVFPLLKRFSNFEKYSIYTLKVRFFFSGFTLCAGGKGDQRRIWLCLKQLVDCWTCLASLLMVWLYYRGCKNHNDNHLWSDNKFLNDLIGISLCLGPVSEDHSWLNNTLVVSHGHHHEGMLCLLKAFSTFCLQPFNWEAGVLLAAGKIMNPSSNLHPQCFTHLLTSSDSIKKLIRFSIAIFFVALAYISVKLCRGFTALIGPHANLIVKFWFRQSLSMCKVFLKNWSGPAGSTAELLFMGFCRMIWIGLLVLHPSDHQEFWSHGYWQSGSGVPTIDLADRLKGEKTGEITTYFNLQLHGGCI